MTLKTFLITSLMASVAITFNSCKKNSAADEIEATFELSGDQAVSDNLTEDANDVFMEAAGNKNLLGQGPTGFTQTMGNLSCATVTVTPLAGFPKNISIDFGIGCTSNNGIFRSGKINIILSDSVRKTGSTAVMTFDNYFVNLYKKEGTITWTNTSVSGGRSWQRKVESGKITAPDGRYWLHSGIRNVVQVAGIGTPTDLTDDVFSITGNHSVTNSSGNTRTCTVLTALEKKVACNNIDKGTVKVQGPNHYATIDFGDGTCDNLATLSIDGRPSRTVILR